MACDVTLSTEAKLHRDTSSSWAEGTGTTNTNHRTRGGEAHLEPPRGAVLSDATEAGGTGNTSQPPLPTRPGALDGQQFLREA